jgi:hypothetical protein
MRRFLLHLLLLSVPVWLLAAADLVLAPDAFTFRGWEALKVTPLLQPTSRALHVPLVTAFPGPFVPDSRLTMVEEGDVGHHTTYSRPRVATWEIDAHGFRERAGRSGPYDLVVVGDSYVAGCGQSQEDTLAEVLEQEHGIPTYPFAPANMSGFLADPRFRERPPRHVVIECVERNVLQTFAPAPIPEMPVWVVRGEAARRLEFALSRMVRLRSLAYLRARLAGPRPVQVRGGELFLAGPEAFRRPDPGRVAAAADSIAREAAQARERGARVAVLLVPDKETIHSDAFPDAPAPTLLPALTEALRDRGVTVLDVEPAFRAARATGTPTYFPDDSHWNRTGVGIAASALAGWMAGNAPVGSPSPGAP